MYLRILADEKSAKPFYARMYRVKGLLSIVDGWLYGRGAGDMKNGIAANLYAVEALKAVGYQPAATLYQQSVIEEECTGNGALATILRGYRADGVLITEPHREELMTAQVGINIREES